MVPIKEREPFNPTTVSANRVNAYLSCGVAFQREYIDRVPPERSGAAALNGSVWHKALEDWSLDRKGQDLLPLIEDAWLACTKDDVSHNFVKAFQKIAPIVQEAEAECVAAFEKRTGKPSKAIRMSGEWKRHPMSKRIDTFLARWNEKLTNSYYRFGEWDSLPTLYTQSLSLGKKYAARMADAPNAWETEAGFTVAFNEFHLNGYIDSIEPVVNAKGDVVAIGVKDYKTYAKEPAPLKDWRQRVIYYIAVQRLLQTTSDVLLIPTKYLDLPIKVGMDYIKWDESWETPPVVWYDVTQADIDQLAIELRMYHDGVSHGIFMPAEKGRNPDYCGYGEDCCLRKRDKPGMGGVFTP